MRILVGSMFIVFALTGQAAAEERVQLRLQLEPAANDAELVGLMRQNTVRIALQRHRLWQEASEKEATRERTQKRTQKRAEKRTSKAVNSSKASSPVNAETSQPSTMKKENASKPGTHVEPAARETESKEVGKMAETKHQDKAQLKLRNILRKKRVTGQDALGTKLEQQLREEKRRANQSGQGKGTMRKRGAGKRQHQGR